MTFSECNHGRVQPRVETEQFRLRGNRIAWAFVPYVAFCQAVQLAFPVPGMRWVTFEFFALILIVGVTAPWWTRRWRELPPTTLITAGAFLTLVAYGLVSLFLHPPPVVRAPGGGVMPRYYEVVPLLSAALTVVAGFGVVLTAERHLRLRILTVAGAAAVAVSYLGWPFQSAYRGYVRLATGQGGAAIIHVMFLLIMSLGLAQFVRGSRPRLGIAIVVGGLGALIATQSRGAFINVAAWVGLIVVGLLISHPRDAKRLWPLGAAALAGLVALPFIPGIDRITDFWDPKRAKNIDNALELWGEQPIGQVFGLGPGSVWPWPAYESGLYPMPEEGYAGFQPSDMGNVLLTPHSTPLQFMVEFGIPGVILGAVMGIALLVGWWRARTTLPRLIVASAVLACLVAFLVDTYLLRNFGISLWWWALIALTATWPFDKRPNTAEV